MTGVERDRGDISTNTRFQRGLNAKTRSLNVNAIEKLEAVKFLNLSLVGL